MFDKQIPNMLLGDPLRITQILLNLANNAIKFTESGEVIVRLRLKSRIDNMVNLVFEVEDTGIGMTPKQVNKLFSPFAQADVSTTRKYGGTGLGLVISKNLVEMMKGTMELKSEYGKGSTFFFELPFQVSNKKQDEKAVPVEFSNLKALVVDDNYTARLILRNYLEDFNFTVDVASSGYDAVDMIDASYNLVLLDWKMPGMDGIQAWDKIKQKMSDETPNVIMVIAYDKSELNLSENSGIDTMLMKPVNPSTLFNAIIYELGMDAVSSSKKSEIDTVEGMESIRGARILVVDDNMINQQIAKETLENEGFWIILADNGQIACDILNSRDDIDIVLMDLQMPVLDGYQATEKIRAEISKTIPIIALSADAMKGTRERAQSIGMNSYVTKPIDFKILYTIMVEYIKGDGFKLNETQQLETVTDNEREEYLIKALPTFDMVRNLSLFSNKESFLLDILGTTDLHH